LNPKTSCTPTSPPSPVTEHAHVSTLDRNAKQFIGGKQARPDSGYSYSVLDPKGRSLDEDRRQVGKNLPIA